MDEVVSGDLRFGSFAGLGGCDGDRAFDQLAFVNTAPGLSSSTAPVP
ncbi:MAG: hypothetical protein QOC63_4051, partial [Mycobacterium sp.]|nr:hypothetical protein [Mycobacterium sp.]